MSGTSMSTPHVAGVAALWAHKETEETTLFSAETVVARLVGTAEFLSGADASDIGSGLVQAPVGKRFQYAWSK